MSHSFKLAKLARLLKFPKSSKKQKTQANLPASQMHHIYFIFGIFLHRQDFWLWFLSPQKTAGFFKQNHNFSLQSTMPTKMYNFHVPHDRIFLVPLTNIKYESEFIGFKDFIKTSEKIHGCILAPGSRRFCKYVRASYIFCAVLGKNIA